MKKQNEKKVELKKQTENKVGLEKPIENEQKKKKKKRKDDEDYSFWGELFGEILLEGIFMVIWRIIIFIPRLIIRLLAAIFD